MIVSAKQSSTEIPSGVQVSALDEVVQKPEVDVDAIEVEFGRLDLKNLQLEDKDAEAVARDVERLFGSAAELDDVLEQTKLLRASMHDPLIQEGVEVLTAYITAFLVDGVGPVDGHVSDQSPGGEVCKAFKQALDETPQHVSGTTDLDLGDRTHKVLEALSKISKNEWDDPHARRFSNAANLIVHSFMTAGLPTTLRVAVAYAIEQGMQRGNFDLAARTAVGAIVGALPLLVGAVGLVRDNVHGTPTTCTNISRGSMLLLGAGVLCYGGITGSLAKLAPTLVAYTGVQKAMSELFQSFVKKTDNTPDPKNLKSALSGLAVLIVQGLITYSVYSHLAPNAGQGVATKGEGWQPMHDLARGAIATAMTTGGAFLLNRLHDWINGPETREDLRTSLKAAMPEREDVVNRLFGSYAATSIGANSYFIIDEILAPFFEDKGLSEAQRAAIKDTLCALIDGVRYVFEKTAIPPAGLTYTLPDVERGTQGRGELRDFKKFEID